MRQQVCNFVNKREQKCKLVHVAVDGDQVIGSRFGWTIITIHTLTWFADFQFEIKMKNPVGDQRHCSFRNILRENGLIAGRLIHPVKLSNVSVRRWSNESGNLKNYYTLRYYHIITSAY